MNTVKDPDCKHEDTMIRMVNEWQLPLLRFCYIQLQDKALAEDAVQETFMKAFVNLSRFRGDCSEKTWLFKIAVNTCRDVKRSAWFRHTDRKVTPDMLPEPAAVPSEDRVELTLAVMNLPRKYREPIVLYYYQDMKTSDIGTALGIAQSSVSNRLRKGKELLRQALERRDWDA